jgi:long-chain acyl-CoA synthetase
MEFSDSGNIIDLFKRTAKQFPDEPALIYLGSKYTYSQVEQMVESLAASLSRMGIGRDDKAIIYLPNLPQWVIAWLALQRIGAVAVPITPYYVPYDLKFIANNCGAETIFCMNTNFGYVTRVLSETSLKRVIVTTMVEFLPLWKQVLGKVLNKVPEGGYRLGEQVYAFKSLLKARGRPLAQASHRLDHVAEILYTGGTTGYPKGVPISNVLFLESAEEQRKARRTLIPPGDDVIIQGGALYHILGQAVGLGALLYGDTVILLARINLDALFDHISRYEAKTFFGVPTMYRMLLEHDRVDQYDLSSLKYCFSGGDVLPLDVARRWQAKYGIPIYQGYGATETCGGISLTPAGESFPEGTAGHIVSFQKVRLVDPDTLSPLESGQPGELLVSSDHMASGYWNNPEETQESFVNINGRLWYRTGDIVRIDEDGWLFFLDRAADTIKHKGYRVAASKVESVLQDHLAVTAACVVGIPDDHVGERIKAFVVLREDVKGVTANDLIVHCRQKLAPYEVPHYIEIRDMLPKSKVGKLLRRELRADERRKLEADEVF